MGTISSTAGSNGQTVAAQTGGNTQTNAAAMDATVTTLQAEHLVTNRRHGGVVDVNGLARDLNKRRNDPNYGQLVQATQARLSSPERELLTAALATQEPPMPGVGTALMQGLWQGGRDLAQTGEALAGGRPQLATEQNPAAAPLEWNDLLSPFGEFAPKLAYQLGGSWPTLAGGIAGTAAGVAIVGGPEDPVSWITGPAGGFIGAGLANGLQTFGNYFGEELKKTPGDADGAYDRALERATVSGVFSGAAWAAFPARAFQGPLKNMMFQAFGVQPGIAVAHKATDNLLTDQPITDGLGQAYTQGALGTLPIAAGQALGHRVGEFAGQYEMQIDPNALGANGGNVRFVKRGAKPETRPAAAERTGNRVENKPTDGPLDISKLTVQDVPAFRSGEFNAWFDARTPQEIAQLYKNKPIKKKIESGLRGNGGMHEYLMVAKAPHWKAWGLTAEQVQTDFAVRISDLNQGGIAKGWTHSNGDGLRAVGSGEAHAELQAIIEASNSLPAFKENIKPWAEKWLNGGYDALPAGFHN